MIRKLIDSIDHRRKREAFAYHLARSEVEFGELPREHLMERFEIEIAGGTLREPQLIRPRNKFEEALGDRALTLL